MLLAKFKMPWRDLAETGARARAFGGGEVNLSSNSELWSLYQKVRTHFPQNTDSRATREARGGSDLNRTLDESPRHRLADSVATPKEKTLLAFLIWRG